MAGQIQDRGLFIGGREIYLLIYLPNGSIASSNIAWEGQIKNELFLRHCGTF